MDGRALVGGNPATVLSGLLDFSLRSASTCLSQDADRLCVSAGLGVLSALSLLLSFLLLVFERCSRRRQSPEEIGAFPYSLLGNLCAAVGATLAGLLHIQVLLSALAAALDALHFLWWCLHLFLCWNSKSERRRRMMRGRRRQHLLAVCALTAVGGLLRAAPAQLAVQRPVSGRRLMHAALQDNSEILGFSLGLLSWVIACTSRFPLILRTHRGRVLTRPGVVSRLLSSLAAALYAAAVLVFDSQLGFLLKALPWSLSAACCCALDLAILFLHWLRRRDRVWPSAFPPDSDESSDSDCASVKTARSNEHADASAQRRASGVQKLTELGPYMDVSAQPGGKLSPPGVMAGKQQQEEGQALNRQVRGSRVGSLYSSDTSYDSSASSDLEWDFEENTTRWIKTAAKQFLQQGWSKPPRLCTSAVSAARPLSGREESESVSSAGPPKIETAAYFQ